MHSSLHVSFKGTNFLPQKDIARKSNFLFPLMKSPDEIGQNLVPNSFTRGQHDPATYRVFMTCACGQLLFFERTDQEVRELAFSGNEFLSSHVSLRERIGQAGRVSLIMRKAGNHPRLDPCSNTRRVLAHICRRITQS